MLKYVISFFKDEGVRDITPEDFPKATAHVDADGNLFAPTGEFIGSYSRRRDAFRAAKRRGFEVA